MPALSGIDSDVWVTALPSVSIGGTPEPTTDSGDHITYTTNTHHYWDKNQAITVQVSANGSTGWTNVDPIADPYTFQYVGGKIIFKTARVVATNNFVRLSVGSYFNLVRVDEASDWSLSPKGAIEDTTPFQSAGGWRRKTATVKEASGKIGSFIADATLFDKLNKLCVFQLFVSKTGNSRWEFYGYPTGIDPKSSATGIISQDIGFDVDGDVFYVPS
jgi:hypothetical protein